jgi:putative membrane protein
MKTFAILAAAVIAISAASNSALAQADQKFIKEAIEGNLAAVQMGQLAQKNGASQDVKDFGQLLVTDHGQANTKATDVANSLKVTPPAEPNAKQKKEYDRISKLNGAAFDKAFAARMIADHKKDIAEYQKESKSKNPTVAAYAGDALATLHNHLKSAQALQKDVKSTTR